MLNPAVVDLEPLGKQQGARLARLRSGLARNIELDDRDDDAVLRVDDRVAPTLHGLDVREQIRAVGAVARPPPRLVGRLDAVLDALTGIAREDDLAVVPLNAHEVRIRNLDHALAIDP